MKFSNSIPIPKFAEFNPNPKSQSQSQIPIPIPNPKESQEILGIPIPIIKVFNRKKERYHIFLKPNKTPVPAFSKRRNFIFGNEIFKNFTHGFLIL